MVGAPGAAWSDVIAYNFSENPGNQQLDTTTPKGPTATSRWNDSNVRDSGSLGSGSEANLVDDSGTPTSASITWNSSGTWWNGSGTGSEEARLVVGYLDDGGSGVQVTVEDIPYASYNVYGIVGSGAGDTYTSLDFNVNGTWAYGGASPATATAFGNWGASGEAWVQIEPGVTTGNYWKMEGLSGANLTIQGQTNNGSRGSLVAIVIEEAAFTAPSFVNKPGINNLPAVALGDSLTSTFRPELDEMTVTDVDGLTLGSPGDTHYLEILPRPGLTSTTCALFRYSGTFGGAGFAGLQLNPIPNTRYSIQLVDNVAESSVDLVYEGPEPVLWTGATDNVWDLATDNWKLETAGTATAYQDLDVVKFGDLAGTSDATVDLGVAVAPLSVEFDNTGTNFVVSGAGAIGGETTVTKTGAGSVALQTVNTFSGALSILGGTLVADQAGSLGANGGAVLIDGGTLAASASFGTGRAPVIGAGGGTIDVAAEETFSFNASGFKGGNTLVKTGDGTLRFAGYGGGTFEGSVEVAAGTLAMAGGGFNQAIGLDQIVVQGGATLLQPAGAYHALGGYYANVPDLILEEGSTYQVDQENYLDLVDMTGATVQGAAQTRTDDNFSVYVYSSPTVSTWNASINTVLKDAGFYVEDGPLAVDAVIGGEIVGTMGLVKQGPGALEINAANTYTGTTTVEEGALLLGGFGDLASPAINVWEGATLDVTPIGFPWVVIGEQTLQGNGSAVGDIEIDGTVAPGSSAGALTFEDSLTFYGGSTYAWEVSSWDAAAEAGYDYDLIVAGTFGTADTAGNPVVISIAASELLDFSETARTFTIVEAGVLSGFDPADFTIDDSAFKTAAGAYGDWSVQANGNDIELVYTAGVATPYESWAAVQGFAPGEDGIDFDADGDGLANGIEFVVGGEPTGTNDADKLPSATLTNDDLVFTFRQTAAAAGSGVTAEYGSSLAGWTTAQDGVNGVTIAAGPDDTDGTPTVVVTLPRSLAPDGKFFVRLKLDES